MQIQLGLSVVSLSAVILLCFCVSAQEVVYPLEHAIGSGKFTSAGQLSGDLVFNLDKGSWGSVFELNIQPTSAAEKQELSRTIYSDGLYRLRLPSVPTDSASPKVIASVRARCLARPNAPVRLVVHATPLGEVVALDYEADSCKPGVPAQALPADWELPLAAAVQVKVPAQAPVIRQRIIAPPAGQGAAGQQARRPAEGGAGQGGAEGEGGAGEEGPPEPEKSWLQKNWMIVVPAALMLVNLLGNAMGEPPARPGQGRPGNAGAPAARRGR